jgi:predicted nucleic acid-binding protein
MRRYTLDTNFIVSLLNEKDSNHKKAKEIAKTINNDYILIPSVVIAEIMSYTKNKKFRDTVLNNTMKILSEIFFLNLDNLEEYVQFRSDFDSSLTAIDSIILYSAISTNSKLITFDKKLDNLYKSMI